MVHSKLWKIFAFMFLIAVPVCFGASTHMGVEPQELVSLIRHCYVNDTPPLFDCFMRRTFATGELEDNFKIPEGKMLIVTDYEWKYVNTEPNDLAGTLLRISIHRSCLDPQDACLTSHFQPASSFAEANEFGPILGGGIYASGNAQMTTGFAVASNRKLSVHMEDMLGGFLPTSGEFIKLELMVRGYLVASTCGIPGTPACR